MCPFESEHSQLLHRQLLAQPQLDEPEGGTLAACPSLACPPLPGDGSVYDISYQAASNSWQVSTAPPGCAANAIYYKPLLVFTRRVCKLCMLAARALVMHEDLAWPHATVVSPCDLAQRMAILGRHNHIIAGK